MMADVSGKHARRRFVTHALGNVFLGIAVGLLGYYALTDIFTRLQQRDLVAELPPEVAAAEPAETPVTAEPVFDFEGWEEEDLAHFEKTRPGQPFGRLVAKTMGLDAVVVKGTRRSDLTRGPGWVTWSDLPGPTGNFGIAGHRTTYAAPFRRMERLEVGDTVSFISPYRTYTYRVVRVFTVKPSRGDVMASTDKPMLTMSACHPLYSARLRLIAQSELVAVTRLN